MTALVFTVPGTPVAKARARSGRNRRTGRPVHYTPPETKIFEGRVKNYAWVAMRDRGLAPMKRAASLLVDAYWPAKKHARHTTPIPKDTKPDWDNVGKIISDSLNKVCFTDDGRITDGRARTWWDVPGEPGRTVVTVESLTGEWGP